MSKFKKDEVNNKNENIEYQYELIEKIKNKNDYKSYLILLSKYKPLIKSLSIKLKTQYNQTPIQKDDIENILSFNFYDLTKKYSRERGMSFPSYIKKYLAFRGINYLKFYITNNHKSLNYSSNLEDNFMRGEVNQNKEEESEKLLQYFEDSIDDFGFSEKEKYVFNQILKGKKLTEIGKEMNTSKQYVFTIKKRCIKKIEKQMENKF